MGKFEIRGVIEGFYGRPWTWTERESMIDFLGAHGYNLYIYAPKDDPIHRDRWMEPYLPEELELFEALADRAGKLGVEFVFAISPLKFFYSSAEQLETLWGKLTAVYERGIRSFALFVDDMPDKFHHQEDESKFASIAHAQAWLVNTLYARLEGLGGVKRVFFCPTEYCGKMRSPYLETIGAEIRREVEIFWTGPEVCSQYLKTEDAKVISETLRRPVLYWDNYPVNDGAMQWTPHIRPVRGRDADLWQVAKGIVANAALQPENSKLPLATYGDYLNDPEGYDPERSWSDALLEVTRNLANAEDVDLLGDLTRWAPVDRGTRLKSRFAPKLNRFWERWGGAPSVAGPDLPDALPTPTAEASSLAEKEAAVAEMTAEFTRLKEAAVRLQTGMTNKQLQAELLPWSQKLDGWADTGLLTMEVLRRSLSNPADPELPSLRRTVLGRLLSTRENFHWVMGDLIDQFSRRCLWAAKQR